MLVEKARKLLSKGYICDHCLGRQFAQLLSGTENSTRGETLRYFFAMKKEAEEDNDVDHDNFTNFEFRNVDVEGNDAECYVCEGLFERVDEFASMALSKLQGYEFDNFLVGTRLPDELVENEEKIWADVGIENCEQMKAELNRLVGKKVCERTGKEVNFELPEVVILVDVEEDEVKLDINSLCVYGEYNKMSRELPQTKWPSGKYETSVEEKIAPALMERTEGSAHKFHGAGREDIDARCLGWRPFILEVLEPVKRNIVLEEVEEEISEVEDVEVRNLKIVGRDEVPVLKQWHPDKSYRAKVIFSDQVDDNELDKLSDLVGVVKQRTPQRVSHRRADKYRKREIKEVDWERIDEKTIDLYVKAEAGTYIKELISGDDGRSEPSVSELLNSDAECVELDVTDIHNKEELEFL